MTHTIWVVLKADSFFVLVYLFASTDMVLFVLQVIQKFVLKKNQDITAMTLNSDNTNLVVSTSDSQLLVFTDPAVSTFSLCLLSC
jgi:hypothetical protein